MNSDVMESVLQEILKEQKETLKLNKQLLSKIEYLSGKLESVEKEINTHQNTSSTDDTKVYEIENIKQVVIAQQENIIPEKRIIIFPEFKSPECYRLLFNCILYLTIATYSFLIIKVVIDHWCK
jgi:hypothetical protein